MGRFLKRTKTTKLQSKRHCGSVNDILMNPVREIFNEWHINLRLKHYNYVKYIIFFFISELK